jgi:RNase P/RNase MRP subunit POP5
MIIRVNRKQLNDVKTALIIARLSCVGVSGTLKKARQKFLTKV